MSDVVLRYPKCRNPTLRVTKILLRGISVYFFSRSPTGEQKDAEERVAVAIGDAARDLDILVLKTLLLGPAHGYTIAHSIEQGSEEVLQIEHGSLYPALHRLQNRGWVASFNVGQQSQREVLPADAER